jgi:hypothetical protein
MRVIFTFKIKVLDARILQGFHPNKTLQRSRPDRGDAGLYVTYTAALPQIFAAVARYSVCSGTVNSDVEKW